MTAPAGQSASRNAHPPRWLAYACLGLSMSLVGSVVRNGRQHALVKVDNLLHYVKVGEYMGQNYEKITNLTEKELTLREIVQDASGEWIERTSTLQLQEKAQ